MYDECKICKQEIKSKSARGLAYHLNFYHKDVNHEDYYKDHIDSRSTCKGCGKEMKFHGLTSGFYLYCKPCSTKNSWEYNSDRKEAQSKRFKDSNPSVGRPKGSKNKQPWSLESRKKLSETLKGRQAPWNTDSQKIHSQQKTWEDKDIEEVKEIMSKQIETKMERGTNMSKYYQGRYKPKSPEKYKGDPTNITYRSSWEKMVLLWCDSNSNVKYYSSEEVVIPYFYDVDKKYHKYFVDMLIEFKDGKTILVEIKPKKETMLPVKQGKTKQRYLNESLTYVKNQNKWKAAFEFAKDRSWGFEIWTEDTLKSMGIMKELKPKKKLKPMKPFKKPSKKS